MILIPLKNAEYFYGSIGVFGYYGARRAAAGRV